MPHAPSVRGEAPRTVRPPPSCEAAMPTPTERIALVTGGMGGLGEAIAIRLHAQGHRVAVTHSRKTPTSPTG